MLKPAPCNQAEDAGIHLYEILTIKFNTFVHNGFVSEEFTERTMDVVDVGGRYFGVSETIGSENKWKSVTLPPELDPAPTPREWDMWVSPTGDLVSNSDMLRRESIRVREITDQ